MSRAAVQAGTGMGTEVWGKDVAAGTTGIVVEITLMTVGTA